MSSLNAAIRSWAPSPAVTAKRADVVGQPGLLRGDEVGQGPVGDALAVLALLAQVVQRGEDLGAVVVGVDLDVVAVPRWRARSRDAPGGQPLLGDHPVEHRPARRRTACGRSRRCVGLLRMSGNLPFISQALKNGCQSM